MTDARVCDLLILSVVFGMVAAGFLLHAGKSFEQWRYGEGLFSLAIGLVGVTMCAMFAALAGIEVCQ